MTLKPFTSWEESYRILSQECGSVTLTDWSEVTISGSDRITFLHNMCTNDIRRLMPGQCCEAFLLNVKGKIQAHVFVFVEENQISLLSVPEQAQRILGHLERYIIRENVELTDASGNRSWAYVVGPAARDKLASQVEQDSELPADNFRHTSCLLAGQQCLVARLPLLWPGGFLVATEEVGLLLDRSELMRIDTNSPAWTSLRVESLFPCYDIDFTDLNLPQEVNRENQTISFTKGCYLGQETVARIDALGHVNKKLVVVSFDSQSAPETGAQLIKDKEECGSITTVCWSPRKSRPAALALVKRSANELGSKLESPVGMAVVEAATPSEK